MEFKVIKGLVGKYLDNEILVDSEKSDPKAVDAMMTYLTAEDKGVVANIKRLEKLSAYNEKHALKIKQDLETLREQVIRHYYAVNDEGFISVPPGFYYLFESFSEGICLGKISLSTTQVGGREARYYQVDSVTEALKYKRAMIVLATGLGKSLALTLMTRSLADRGLRVLIIVPTINLVKQMLTDINQVIDKNKTSGIGGTYKYKEGAQVTVSTINSGKHYSDLYDAVLVDECFPFKQCVMTEKGPAQLGSLWNLYKDNKELPMVMSYNEITKVFEYKKILKVIKNEHRENLLEIKTGRTKTQCTENHRFLTIKGWKRADELVPGDLFVSTNSSSAKAQKTFEYIDSGDKLQVLYGSYLGDGSFQEVGNGYRIRVIHGEKQKEYCEWKASIFGSKLEKIEKNGFAQTVAYRFNSKTFYIDGSFDMPKKQVPEVLLNNINWLGLAIWYMDDGSIDQKTKTQLTFHVESLDMRDVENLSKMLKDRFGIENKILTYFRKDREKTYPIIRLNKEATLLFLDGVRPYIHKTLEYKTIGSVDTYELKHTEYNYYAAIDSIKPYFYEANKTGKGLYDLTVEDNHNYMVCSNEKRFKNDFGIIAHNCHHSSSNSYYELATFATKAKYFYGFTATPVRGDGLELGFHGILGKVVYTKNTREGIAEGFLCPVSVTCVTIRGLGSVRPGTNDQVAYKHFSTHEKTLHYMKDLVKSALSKGLKVLVLFKTVEPGVEFCEYMSAHGIESSPAHSKYQKPYFDFKDGKTNLLVSNSSLLGEGVDIPEIDFLISIVQNSSESLTRQIIGRGLRLKKGGRKLRFVDITTAGFAYKNTNKDGSVSWFDILVHKGKQRKKIYEDITDDIVSIEV